MWINWNDLPGNMKNEQVRPYYEKLKQKRGSLITKRLFDILVSLVMLILLSWLFLILAIAIKVDSAWAGILPTGACNNGKSEFSDF